MQTSSAHPHLLFAGRLARIEFRDAARRNALDANALAALVAAIARVTEAPGCDALLLAGDGPAFCAGFDLAGCSEDPRRVEVLRTLMMSNDLLDGDAAVARGLATHCVAVSELDAEVDALVARILAKGPQAMRATKRWIREIESRMPGDLGSTPARDRASAQAARDASLALAGGEEFATMLRAFWAARAQKESR